MGVRGIANSARLAMAILPEAMLYSMKGKFLVGKTCLEFFSQGEVIHNKM